MSGSVVIAYFNSLPDAYLARNILEVEDISCVLDNEHTVAVYNSALALVEIRLRVHESDAREAVALLVSKGIIPPPGEPVSRSGARCPRCNGGHVKPTLGMIFRTLLSMLIAGPVSGARYRCKDCGHTWRG